jgi:hypothetical protein
VEGSGSQLEATLLGRISLVEITYLTAMLEIEKGVGFVVLEFAVLPTNVISCF